MAAKTKLEPESRRPKSQVVEKVNDAERVTDAFENNEDPVKRLMQAEISNDSVETAKLMAKKQRLEAQIDLEETQTKFNKSKPSGGNMTTEIPAGAPNWIKEMIGMLPEDERAGFIEKHSAEIFRSVMGGGSLQGPPIYEQLLARQKENGNGGGDQFMGIAALMSASNEASMGQQRMMMELMRDGRENTKNQPNMADVAKLMASAIVEVGKTVNEAIKPVLEKNNTPQNNEQMELLRKEIQDLRLESIHEKYGQTIGALAEQIDLLKTGQNGMGKAFEAVKYLKEQGVPISTETSSDMHEKNTYAIAMKKLEMQDSREKLELEARKEEAVGRQSLLQTIGTIVNTGSQQMKLASMMKDGKNKGTKNLMGKYR